MTQCTESWQTLCVPPSVSCPAGVAELQASHAAHGSMAGVVLVRWESPMVALAGQVPADRSAQAVPMSPAHVVSGRRNMAGVHAPAMARDVAARNTSRSFGAGLGPRATPTRETGARNAPKAMGRNGQRVCTDACEAEALPETDLTRGKFAIAGACTRCCLYSMSSDVT